MNKFVGLVAGSASSALQFWSPLEGTWIGHDKWASDNLTIAATVGAVAGLAVFFLSGKLSRKSKIIIASFFLIAGLIGFGISIYWSFYLDSVVAHDDQVFYRDWVWRLAHLSFLTSLTVFLFCLSFFDQDADGAPDPDQAAQ